MPNTPSLACVRPRDARPGDELTQRVEVVGFEGEQASLPEVLVLGDLALEVLDLHPQGVRHRRGYLSSRAGPDVCRAQSPRNCASSSESLSLACRCSLSLRIMPSPPRSFLHRENAPLAAPAVGLEEPREKLIRTRFRDCGREGMEAMNETTRVSDEIARYDGQAPIPQCRS